MLSTSEIKKAVSAKPFRPFRLRSADGEEYAVPHPEFIAFHPRGRDVIVFAPSGGCSILDVLLLTAIHFSDPPEASGVQAAN